MERATHVNDFINSLPRIRQRKVWAVRDESGATVQYVGATDNRKRTAQKYIDEKYPSRTMTLVFSHYNGLITIPQ